MRNHEFYLQQHLSAGQGADAVADPDAEWRERVQTVPARNPRMIFDETNSDSELPQRLLAENQQRMEEAARAEDIPPGFRRHWEALERHLQHRPLQRHLSAVQARARHEVAERED